MNEQERKQVLGDLDYKLLQVDYRGKPLKSVTGLRGMVKLWALQNTRGKKVSYIADNSGKVVMIVKGNGTNFPDVLKGAEVPVKRRCKTANASGETSAPLFMRVLPDGNE